MADDHQNEMISEIVGATTPLTRRSRRFRAYFLEQLVSPTATEKSTIGADNTEIVVELAHGQRLVVRGIEPGVIVEVAAWSGTDAPGESAVRMLFGAGRTTDDTTEIQPAQPGSDSLPPEIDWDEPRDDVRTLESLDEPVVSATDIARQRQQRRRQMVRKMVWTLGSLAAVVALILGLSAMNLVRFVHPSSGITNTLGGAETTIAVIGPTVDLEPDSSVLVASDGELVLGGVIAVDTGQVLVYTGNGQTVVQRDDVVGRVLFVIPFVGLLAGVFGQ